MCKVVNSSSPVSRLVFGSVFTTVCGVALAIGAAGSVTVCVDFVFPPQGLQQCFLAPLVFADQTYNVVEFGGVVLWQTHEAPLLSETMH